MNCARDQLLATSLPSPPPSTPPILLTRHNDDFEDDNHSTLSEDENDFAELPAHRIQLKSSVNDNKINIPPKSFYSSITQSLDDQETRTGQQLSLISNRPTRDFIKTQTRPTVFPLRLARSTHILSCSKAHNDKNECTTPSLVSIHAEHAEPTFIRAGTNSEQYQGDYNSQTFLTVHNTTPTIKHYKSESDLGRLKGMFPSTATSTQELRRSNSRLSLWNPLRTIRRNQSSVSLKKAVNDDIFRQAGLSGSSWKKTGGGEGSMLHIAEDGYDVLVMEMLSGKLHIIAGTAEKLFIKLADETTQDFDYIDTYLMNYSWFTTPAELLEDLMARFHLEALPGETDYFKKWQRCIQLKWIKLRFQDFKDNNILLTRLEAFLNGDVKRAGFSAEASKIKEALNQQTC
ncbi:hypothetical protein DFQ28_007338 [Apophysomyces sp. BC1034]|nr:hypothetical protein DFQ28_007338 [Apophysomyces sp. BC1034]